jgi:chromosome segregation ATPase
MAMKKLISFLLITVFVYACKPKDETRDAIRAEMTSFRKDWDATANEVNNLGVALDNTLKKMLADSATNDSQKKDCIMIRPEVKKTQYNMKNRETEYNDWEKKFDAKEVPSEDAKKKLLEFKGSLEEYNNQLEEFKNKLKECETINGSASVSKRMLGAIACDICLTV